MKRVEQDISIVGKTFKKRTKDKYVVRLSVRECVGAEKDNLISFLPTTAVGEVMETFGPLDLFLY